MIQYSLRSDDVTHESFADELVIVDLTSGSYYSATGSAPDVWRLLLAGWSPPAIARALAAHCGRAELDVARDVSAFVEDLLREGLMVPAQAPRALGVSGTMSEQFATPALTRYDDLRTLLLLDPIHDVDQTGWPVVRNEETA